MSDRFSTPPDLLVVDAGEAQARPLWASPETIVAWEADPPYASVACPRCKGTFWSRGDATSVAQALVDHECEVQQP